MNQDLIRKLSEGLYLENNSQMLSWLTPFDKLKKLGHPEIIEQSAERYDLVWKNERILNGLDVDLIIMRWFGLVGKNKKFKHAYAYIKQPDFENTIERLDTELGLKAKYKRINSLELKYTWNLDQCKITLMQSDRFGPNWTVIIQLKKRFGLIK